jgi:hypothetical protein
MPWLGNKTAQGYGQLVFEGEKLYAHRVSYSLAYLNGEPIPENLVVRHRCPNGPRVDCVRPSHLELGTYAENSADILIDGRTKVIEPPCENIVAAIRYLYASGRFSQGDISKMIWATAALDSRRELRIKRTKHARREIKAAVTALKSAVSAATNAAEH